jgi:HNH endonuclease
MPSKLPNELKIFGRDRFWPKVTKTSDGCWEWSGSRNEKGYGLVGIPRVIREILGLRAHTVKTHRLAWILSRGQLVPNGKHVLHTCDNPPCCRPRHLFLGTQQINSQDMVGKHRGPDSPPVLTAKDVKEIRRLVANGEPRRLIAAQFGVVTNTVGKIIRGETWKWLK